MQSYSPPALSLSNQSSLSVLLQRKLLTFSLTLHMNWGIHNQTCYYTKCKNLSMNNESQEKKEYTISAFYLILTSKWSK